RKRHGALGGKEPRGLERPLHQLARLVGRVDEAEAERLLGVDRAPAEDQILGDGEPGDARQPLGAAPTRDDPEVDLGLAELGRARREAQVTRERELAAAAKRETVHGRDRWLRHGLEQPARLVAERAPALRLLGLEAAHVLDVGARDEGPVAGAREHDDACAVVAGELLQLVAQRRERLDVERVECLGARDRDGRDPVRDLRQDHAATRSRRKSPISVVGAPGVKISATPSPFSSSASSRGIVPPTTTSTSSAPFSLSPSRMRGTSVMCAPERIEIPTASASSWIAVSTICSGVWW